MPESNEVLAKGTILSRFPKLRTPGRHVVIKGRPRLKRHPGIVDMIEDLKVAHVGVVSPEATVDDILVETIAAVEPVQACLPDPAGLAAARHITYDLQDVAAPLRVKRRVVTKVR